MSIPCSGCGREYDVTLFPFGRTITCTCGRRVGLEKRLHLRATAEPAFVADAMLGKLARWLRILGYDTAYDAAAEDATLVRMALMEGRHILTRDRRLVEEWRVDGCVLLASDDPSEQLRELIDRFGLDLESRLFTRCPACNGMLEAAPAESVGKEVPERVRSAQRAFSRCPDCGAVYWKGSHTRRIRRHLDSLMDGSGGIVSD